MRLTVHPSANSFLQAAHAVLEANEVVNGLVLGIALRLRDDPAVASSPFYLATVEDENGLALVGLKTTLKLLLYAPHPPADQALRLVAADLLQRQENMPGVNGPAELSRAFAHTWQQMAAQALHVETRLRLYELRQVIWPPQPDGVFRPARDADADLLADWSYAFQAEAIGDADRAEARRVVEVATQQNRLFVWQGPNQPVTMAASTRPTAHGMSVSLVYTPPELRRRGYASACVAAVSQHILDLGKSYCTLFTNLANPISNSIYQKIGYRPVCDFEEIGFERN